MPPRPTIQDVAQLAGVHPATVSRALDPRREGRVAGATAERVRAAARHLGYVPDPVARTLRSRRSAAIGVVVPDLANPVFPPIVQGIEDALAEAGYVTLITHTGNDPRREQDRIAALQARRCDGYILASATLDGGGVAALMAGDAPVVLVNRETDSVSLPSVGSDDRAGIRAVIEHLKDLGHTAIAHLTGPPNLSIVRTRVEAFRSSAEHLGLNAGLMPVRYCPALTAADSRDGAVELLREHPAVTAIVAGNDNMAMGCYAAAAQLGRSCPEDISVVGYNDVPSSEWWRPALTTVRIPQYEIGFEAARLLLERAGRDAEFPAKQVLLPVSLVVRSSTAAVG
jgi:LacI family transcriptional regulator